jgi:membrane protease YdiL (CAAX protease family)
LPFIEVKMKLNALSQHNIYQRIKQHPLISFFILAYGISWAAGAPAAFIPEWPGLLSFLTAFGPAIAAFAVVGVIEGRAGVRQLFASLFNWRVRIGWYLVVLLGPALTMVLSIVLYRLLGKGTGIPEAVQILPMLKSQIPALLIVFLYQLIILWGEEVGWRGYALPEFQAKYHPLVASIILGVLWGFWHLPSFWIESSVHHSMTVPFFILASIGYSILYTWIYNGTKGSLWMMCLLHAANNTTVSYTTLFFKPILEAPVFSLVVLALFDLMIILLAGPRLLWGGEREIMGD